jgi:hypothetical protein
MSNSPISLQRREIEVRARAPPDRDLARLEPGADGMVSDQEALTGGRVTL